MVKDPASPYQAGRRGKSWLKVKPVNSLDLVVLAVEPGSGRRSGWLSNIHLGARDPGGDGFVMLGKTFKGMTDEVLRWQTETFPDYVTHEDRYVLHLRPHFVAEIAFNEIQRSSRYPGGLALRFARLKGYRTDKHAEEADSIETVRALFRQMTGEEV
jgi:DNA ligase-1